MVAEKVILRPIRTRIPTRSRVGPLKWRAASPVTLPESVPPSPSAETPRRPPGTTSSAQAHGLELIRSHITVPLEADHVRQH